MENDGRDHFPAIKVMLVRLIKNGIITKAEADVLMTAGVDFDKIGYQRAANIISLIQQGRDNPEYLNLISSNIDEIDKHIFDKDRTQDEVHREALRGKLAVVESTVKCPKCKNKKVIVYQLQTRSADEPMTSYYKCTVPSCGNSWKV